MRLAVYLVAACVLSMECLAANAAKRPARSAPKAHSAKQATASSGSAYRRSPYVGAAAASVPAGKIVFSDRADVSAYPASVTKLMTLLLVLEDVRAGKYGFTDAVTATADINACEPSWVGLKVGESMTVRDLCYALMVESANDAAIALGVHSAGSFGGFIARMNARAAELGMSHTTYYNPNGLPPSDRRRYPWKKFNVTTASDQLKLALQLLKMPETLSFTSVKTCDLVKTANGYRVSVTRRVNRPQSETKLAEGEKIIKQFRNHNNVMVKDKQKIFNPDGSEAVDGLKTGYIDAGGSSIVITGQRNGRRAVAVILGSSSAKERDAAASRILGEALGAVSW